MLLGLGLLLIGIFTLFAVYVLLNSINVELIANTLYLTVSEMVVSSFSFLVEDDRREYLDFSDFYITHEESKKIKFEEKLQLIDDDDNVIDEVTISVESGIRNKDSFEVYQYSQDENLLLRAKSVVNCALETLSEVRKMKRNETTKLMRITDFTDVFRIFFVINDLEQRVGSRMKAEVQKSEYGPFVFEGSNVLLLRKLALWRLLGEFTANTINNDGIFCEVHYTVEEFSPSEVMVTRVVGSETMTTLLSCGGRILEHRWLGSKLRLQAGVAKVADEGGESEPAAEGEEEEADTEPPPLVDLDAYWEKKAEVIELLKTYMANHSDVQDMIADFMKNLLFEKPEDPINFADNFFSEFLGISRESETEEDVQENPPSEFSDQGSSF